MILTSRSVLLATICGLLCAGCELASEIEGYVDTSTLPSEPRALVVAVLTDVAEPVGEAPKLRPDTRLQVLVAEPVAQKPRVPFQHMEIGCVDKLAVIAWAPRALPPGTRESIGGQSVRWMEVMADASDPFTASTVRKVGCSYRGSDEVLLAFPAASAGAPGP